MQRDKGHDEADRTADIHVMQVNNDSGRYKCCLEWSVGQSQSPRREKIWGMYQAVSFPTVLLWCVA